MRPVYQAATSLFILAACGEEDPGFEPCGQWPRSALPLAVVSDPSARSEPVEDLEAGVEIWADVSPQLMVFLGELDSSGGSIVSIVATADVDRGEAHKSIAAGTCEFVGAQIFVPPGSRRLARRVGHELGHALGLLHDFESRSIMYPDGEIGGADVTDSDREILLDRYVR